ncbi:MAG TPA: c-type cytochrome [Terriglobales bacterium]|nr:c-type cytochrome [Terriglobales bacterium]
MSTKSFLRKSFVKTSWLQQLALIAVFVLVGVLGAQQAPPPPESKVPPEEAQKANPVKPTAESLNKGKKLYAIDCAMCHGDNGDGKNDMDMKNATDFTNPDVQKKATDGEWFYIIRKGKGDMPPEGPRAKDDDVWNLVNYLRSFGKK